MDQKDFKKLFDKPGSLDLAAVLEVNKKLEKLKQNPSDNALQQLIDIKTSIESFIKAAPPVREILSPYLTKVNEGIKQLSKIEEDEKQ